MAQRMKFEGKNLGDWFKLPYVRSILKQNEGVVLAIGKPNSGSSLNFLEIGDTLEINNGKLTIIRK